LRWVLRLALADCALAVALPEQLGCLIKVLHIGASIDYVEEYLTGRAEPSAFDLVCQLRRNAFDIK
jgi:hypothetical protein